MTYELMGIIFIVLSLLVPIALHILFTITKNGKSPEDEYYRWLNSVTKQDDE